jgi:hypothetical protein
MILVFETARASQWEYRKHANMHVLDILYICIIIIYFFGPRFALGLLDVRSMWLIRQLL